jgi:NAD(P) transhydrogenase subunit alpha
MKHGAVIVDLASEGGGNCVLTKPGETVVTDNGVIVCGPLNLPASMPVPSSTMYSRNAVSLLAEVAPKAQLQLGGDSEITKGALCVHGGEVLHADTRQALGLAGQEGGAA